MSMVGGVTVAAFEAVGSILVIAMLIVPAACAQLLTDRLGGMLILASVVAALSAVLGYLGAEWLNTTPAGVSAFLAGAPVLASVLCAPRHGVLSRIVRNARLGVRIASEDVIATLYRAEEAKGRGERADAALQVAEARRATHGLAGWLAVPSLRWRGQVRFVR